MFRWLKARVEKATTDSMRADLQRFIQSLKGADDRELGTLVVVANAIRMNMTSSGEIPDAALDLRILRDGDQDFKCDMCQFTLSSTVKKFQKMGQPTDAAGTMVWLHSVRALNVPDLRFLGREMWSEISRGCPYALEALDDIHVLGGKNLPDSLEEELAFVPHGLEPRPAASAR